MRFNKNKKMEANNIYEEKIFSKWTTIILVAKFLFILFLSVFLILLKPEEPIEMTVLFILFFVLLLLLAVMINFNMLSIKITPRSIIVGYGIFQNKIPWENIEDCYLDKTSAIRYGGWGIRVGKVDKKWRKVYSTLRERRVVLSLKNNKPFKEFVFSTKNSEEVMNIVKQKIKVE